MRTGEGALAREGEGLTVQASSSNPELAGAVEEGLLEDSFVVSGDLTRSLPGVAVRSMPLSEEAIESNEAADGAVFGCGLPRRVFFTPPEALVNSPLPSRPAFISSCSFLASSSSSCSCCSRSGEASLSGGGGPRCAEEEAVVAEAGPLALPPVFFAMYFLTRIISPSRRPRFLKVEASKSPTISTSILSFSKLRAYRSQSSMSHPALRNHSNQSV